MRLSEQHLVDCTRGKKGYKTWGCDGGLCAVSWKYQRDFGYALDKDYPYKGKDGKCKEDVDIVGSVKEWGLIKNLNVNAMLDKVKEQPMTIGVNANSKRFN